MKDLSESRVLVVDDAAANVDVLVEALRGEYKLSVAMDGEAALRAIEKNPPDIVLLDIMMIAREAAIAGPWLPTRLGWDMALGSCLLFRGTGLAPYQRNLPGLFGHVHVAVRKTRGDGPELVLQLDQGIRHIRIEVEALALDHDRHRGYGSRPGCR